MPAAAAPADPYCLSLISEADEDLALALNFAADADRPRLAALFALQVELRRVPEQAREAPLGEIRLRWWREAVQEIVDGKAPKAHPVLAALAAARAVGPVELAAIDRLIEGRAVLLYREPFASAEAFAAFARDAEGGLAEAAFGAKDADAVAGLGEAYALARFAPRFAPDHAEVSLARARALRKAHAPQARRLPATAQGRIAFLGLARLYLKASDGGSPLARRLALFSAVLAGRF